LDDFIRIYMKEMSL